MSSRKRKRGGDPLDDLWEWAFGPSKRRTRKRKKPPRAKKYPILHFLGLSWAPALWDWNTEGAKELNRDDRKRAARRAARSARKATKATKGRGATSKGAVVKRKGDGRFNGSESLGKLPAPSGGKRIHLKTARREGLDADARPSDDVRAPGPDGPVIVRREAALDHLGRPMVAPRSDADMLASLAEASSDGE